MGGLKLWKGDCTGSRSTADHEAELNTLFDILLPADLSG
jgi:hypothetical protein